MNWGLVDRGLDVVKTDRMADLVGQQAAKQVERRRAPALLLSVMSIPAIAARAGVVRHAGRKP